MEEKGTRVREAMAERAGEVGTTSRALPATIGFKMENRGDEPRKAGVPSIPWSWV